MRSNISTVNQLPNINFINNRLQSSNENSDKFFARLLITGIAVLAIAAVGAALALTGIGIACALGTAVSVSIIAPLTATLVLSTIAAIGLHILKGYANNFLSGVLPALARSYEQEPARAISNSRLSPILERDSTAQRRTHDEERKDQERENLIAFRILTNNMLEVTLPNNNPNENSNIFRTHLSLIDYRQRLIALGGNSEDDKDRLAKLAAKIAACDTFMQEAKDLQEQTQAPPLSLVHESPPASPVAELEEMNRAFDNHVIENEEKSTEIMQEIEALTPSSIDFSSLEESTEGSDDIPPSMTPTPSPHEEAKPAPQSANAHKVEPLSPDAVKEMQILRSSLNYLQQIEVTSSNFEATYKRAERLGEQLDLFTKANNSLLSEDQKLALLLDRLNVTTIINDIETGNKPPSKDYGVFGCD